MTALLVAGTTSDAGKTVVTTALCRAFARRGVRVAPFKAQNMSNNSMVVRRPGAESAHDAEMGRAQWVQALAAGVEPEVAMNPVLLKPGGDRRSHVVVMGQPAGEIVASDFIGGRRTHLAEAAYAAYDDLASRFDLVVCEGAGSPAEINLRADDYVNMGLAQHAGMPVIVVGDIDRGGVFAAMYGTVALLDAADQRLMAGFVVNKFRGDVSLLRPGLDRLEQVTGRRVHGVLPWSPDLWLDSEDALDLASRRSSDEGSLRVAVIRLPRISNFTDVDALGIEPGVDVSFVSDPRSLADADLVVLPGTRATLADLAWLRSRGLDLAILDHVDEGRPVLGICGGFQMLGRMIGDPVGVEGVRGAEAPGLGLLEVTTTFQTDKVLRLHEEGAYEIHHGRVAHEYVEEHGRVSDGVVSGTMAHGSLESDRFRRAFLAEVAELTGRELPDSTASFAAARATRLDLLGDLAEQHLDLDALLALARDGAPNVPLLAPGAEASHDTSGTT
jgi:adenosylcobyric acid synthase